MDSTDWTALALLVYVATATAVAAHAFILRRASVFEPIGQYLLFLSLFTLPLPVRACITLEIEGNVTPQLLELLPYMPVSVLMCALTLPLFSLMYYGSLAARTARWLPMPRRAQNDYSRVAFALLAAFSLLLIYQLTEEAGGLLPFLLLGYGSTEETFGRGYLAIGFPWLFVACLLLAHRYALRRRRLDATLFVVSLSGVLVMQLLTGNRSQLLYMALAVLVFVHYAIRRLNWKFLLPIAAAGFVGLNFLGLIRGSNYENLADFADRTSNSVETADAQPHGFLYTLTIGEFVVPFETLPQMVRTIGISAMPWLGLSYLRIPVYVIPSAVFPDRPLPLANWYMSRFYGGGYGLNEGRAFFFLAEAYLNFAFPGIVLIALFWGWLWGALHWWMLRSNGDPAVVLLYALTVAFMFRCIAGDFSSLVIGTTQQSLSAALIGLAIAGVRWRQRSRRRPRSQLT